MRRARVGTAAGEPPRQRSAVGPVRSAARDRGRPSGAIGRFGGGRRLARGGARGEKGCVQPVRRSPSASRHGPWKRATAAPWLDQRPTRGGAGLRRKRSERPRPEARERLAAAALELEAAPLAVLPPAAPRPPRSRAGASGQSDAATVAGGDGAAWSRLARARARRGRAPPPLHTSKKSSHHPLPLELVLPRLEGGGRVEEIDVGRENLWGGVRGRAGGGRASAAGVGEVLLAAAPISFVCVRAPLVWGAGGAAERSLAIVTHHRARLFAVVSSSTFWMEKEGGWVASRVDVLSGGGRGGGGGGGGGGLLEEEEEEESTRARATTRRRTLVSNQLPSATSSTSTRKHPSIQVRKLPLLRDAAHESRRAPPSLPLLPKPPRRPLRPRLPPVAPSVVVARN